MHKQERRFQQQVEDPRDEDGNVEVTPAELQLPDYYPLNKNSLLKLSHLNANGLCKENLGGLETLKGQLDESLIGYINNKIEMEHAKLINGQITLEQFETSKKVLFKDDMIVNRSRNLARNSLILKERQHKFMNSVAKFKNEMQERQEPELTIETLQLYVNPETIPKQPFNFLEDTWNVQMSSIQTPSNEANIEFEKNLFVTIHPTEPLPFKEVGEDDDLEVEGGKVNLTCPISRTLMVDPYVSKVCGHIFEKSNLREYLRGTKECPECGKGLSFGVVSPDPLTKKRVKFYKRDIALEEVRKKAIQNEEIDKL